MNYLRERNKGYWYVGIMLSLFVIPFFFSMPGHAKGAIADIEDNFETYNTGDLTAQGLWSGSSNFDIQASVVQSGSKAVSNSTNATAGIWKSLSYDVELESVVTITGYLNSNNVSGYLGFAITSQQDRTIANFTCGAYLNIDSEFVVINANSNTAAATGTLPSASTWHKVALEINNDADTCKIRVNDGPWSNTVTIANQATSSQYLLLDNTSNGVGGVNYFDNFTIVSSNSTFEQPSTSGATLEISSPLTGTLTNNYFDILASYNFPNLTTSTQVEYLDSRIYYRFWRCVLYTANGSCESDGVSGEIEYIDYASLLPLSALSGIDDVSVMVPNGTWNLRAFLYSNQYHTTFGVDTEVYTINEVGGIEASTTDIINVFPNQSDIGLLHPPTSIPSGIFSTSTATSICGTDGSTFFSSEKFWCYTNYWLVRPTDGSTAFLKDQFSKIEEIFPFSFIFGTITRLENSLETIQNGTTTTGLVYTNGNTSISFMPADPITDMAGASAKTDIFELEKYFAWIAVMIGFFAIVVKTV